MERSSDCGITPVNEDWPGLITSDDPYLSCPLNLELDDFASSGIRLHVDPGILLDSGSTLLTALGPAQPYGCVDFPSYDSGVGFEYSESELELFGPCKHIIPGQEDDSRSNSGPGPSQDSHGKPETREHIHQLSSPAPDEAVSKSMDRLQERSTPPDSGYNSRTSSSVFWSDRIVLPLMNKSNGSPFGSESTDSGDTEMHVDEESLFDDQDADLYSGRQWSEATIQRLELIYKQTLYSLVGSKAFQHCNPHQEYGTSGGPVSTCSFQSGPEDGTSSGRKRKADEISHEGNHGDHEDGNGDGGEDSQKPSKRFRGSKSENRALRFACPFFKRHPESFRTCGMSDHENSSRVKQHISRKHRMPIYCPRCSEIFKTEHERDAHVRDADCPVGPKADFISATAEQLRTLSRRNVHQTDRDNWYAIYKILFPDDPLPESPYLDPLVSYEVNLVREAFLTAAPVAVRTAIQHVIPEELSDTLQEELEQILRSTHAEVFDQILRRMREDRESARVDRTTTQSSPQVRVSSTPDSGIGSTVRSGSSQDEPESTLNSQYRLTSFASGSFDQQNDGAIPILPLFTPGYDSSEYHMGHTGHIPQSLPHGTFDDFFKYLDPSGDSFVTDQS